MSATATLEAEVKSLRADVAEGNKRFDALLETVKKIPLHPAASRRFGAPGAIIGESPNTSRGFSVMKMLGLITGGSMEETCKVERDLHDRMHKQLAGKDGYSYAGTHRPGEKAFLAPLASHYLQDDLVDGNFRAEIKSLVNAGVEGADWDEMNWIRRKQLEGHGYNAKTLSWLNEQLGGALVAPPEMGEIIELLRNKEALTNAGARTVPLPANGRIQYPRQTSASLTYWLGENSPIPASDIGTGTVTMQAKKLAVLIKMPNELVRFASPAAEAMVRDDMTKSLSLGVDLAGLEGGGTDTRPRGLIRLPFINRITSSSPGANGDQVVANDVYRFIAAVEESNAVFKTFLMRPKTLYKYYQLRADAVAQGDKQGLFLFNLIREAGDGVGVNLGGHDVVTSTQVSAFRSKGSATNLTYIIGGDFTEALIGMFGAIEFAATTQGDTAFVNDQTWVRGIISTDFAVRHEQAFCWMDQLDTQL